jgi:hypothetical protein
MVIAKLYSNTLLAVFNNRAFIRRGNTAISTPTDLPSSIARRERAGSSRGWTNRDDIVLTSKHTEAQISSVPLDVYVSNGHRLLLLNIDFNLGPTHSTYSLYL